MPKVHELLACFTFLTCETNINTFGRMGGVNMYTSAYALNTLCLSTRASLAYLPEVEYDPDIVAKRCQILLDSRKGRMCLDAIWMQAACVFLSQRCGLRSYRLTCRIGFMEQLSTAPFCSMFMATQGDLYLGVIEAFWEYHTDPLWGASDEMTLRTIILLV